MVKRAFFAILSLMTSKVLLAIYSQILNLFPNLFRFQKAMVCCAGYIMSRVI